MDWFRREIGVEDGKAQALPGQTKKDRLTLSITEAVKDAAKVYADRHKTSLSALVEAYLGQLATESQWPRHRATLAEVAGLKGRVLTGVGSKLLPGEALGTGGAYYENGILLVDENDPLSPASINLRATLRGKGLDIKSEWLVAAEAIKKAETLVAKGLADPSDASAAFWTLGN